MIELVVVLLFGSVMIGLSIRANTLYRREARLPMQWSVAGTVNWTAPRVFALSLTPVLAICILASFAAVMVVSTPRPGQEGLEVPVLAVVGLAFVAAHMFHLWLIGRTLRRKGR